MALYKGIAANHCAHEDLIDFLNYVFGMNGHDSGFYRLLPKLYRPQFRPEDYNFAVIEDGKLRASVGAYPISLSVSGQPLSAIGIGNVAVHPFHRGKGYMKDCMRLALEDAVRSGADFAVLGGRRQRYSYFGFEPAGVCGRFTLNRDNLRHCFGSADNTSGYTVRTLTAQDADALAAIDALTRSRASHPVRPADRLYDTLNTWESTVCAVYAPDGAFAGYFLYGGDDIRELDAAGAAHFEGVVRACHAHLGKDELRISVPTHNAALFDFLSDICEGCSLVHTECYNVLNYAKVVRACLTLRAQTETLCDGSVTLEIEGFAGVEKLRLAVEHGVPSVTAFEGECDFRLTHRQAMSALFGIMPATRRALPAPVRSWLPLPLFVPEVDND